MPHTRRVALAARAVAAAARAASTVRGRGLDGLPAARGARAAPLFAAGRRRRHSEPQQGGRRIVAVPA